MQKLPKQHPASFRSRLFICRGVIVFHESKTSVFQILKTAVFRNPHSFANSSKTTRFYYVLTTIRCRNLPHFAAICHGLLTIVKLPGFYYVFTTNRCRNLPHFAPICHFSHFSWQNVSAGSALIITANQGIVRQIGAPERRISY